MLLPWVIKALSQPREYSEKTDRLKSASSFGSVGRTVFLSTYVVAEGIAEGWEFSAAKLALIEWYNEKAFKPNDRVYSPLMQKERGLWLAGNLSRSNPPPVHRLEVQQQQNELVVCKSAPLLI